MYKRLEGVNMDLNHRFTRQNERTDSKIAVATLALVRSTDPGVEAS